MVDEPPVVLEPKAKSVNSRNPPTPPRTPLPDSLLDLSQFDNTVQFAKKFQCLKATWFKGVKPVRPVFILAYGPPGSGKTSVSDEIIRRQGMDPQNFVRILIDEIIEKEPMFQERSAEILQFAENEDVDCTEITAAIQRLYSTCRKSADVLSELMLEVAARQKYNMIMEATGANISWCTYIIRHVKELGYETWVFYPWVPVDKLCARADARAQKNYRYIPHAVIRSISEASQNNFESIASRADSVWLCDNSKDKEKGAIAKDSLPLFLHFNDQYNVDIGRVRKHVCPLPNFPPEMTEGLKRFLRDCCSVENEPEYRPLLECPFLEQPEN